MKILSHQNSKTNSLFQDEEKILFMGRGHESTRSEVAQEAESSEYYQIAGSDTRKRRPVFRL
jgi:hypothetical protein